MQKVGWYRELRHGDPGGPSLHDASPLPDRVRGPVLAHLASGRVAVAGSGQATDVVTGEVVGPLALVTDGEWVWPSDLPHYVETRDAPLPAAFVEHAATTPSHAVDDAALARIVEELSPAAPPTVPRVEGLVEPQPPSRVRVRGSLYRVLGSDLTGLGSHLGVDELTGAVWSVALQRKQASRFVNTSVDLFVTSLTTLTGLRGAGQSPAAQAAALRALDAAAFADPDAWWPTVLGESVAC